MVTSTAASTPASSKRNSRTASVRGGKGKLTVPAPPPPRAHSPRSAGS
jgi:hypothetical protein